LEEKKKTQKLRLKKVLESRGMPPELILRRFLMENWGHAFLLIIWLAERIHFCLYEDQ
jgi:hypothetical protein